MALLERSQNIIDTFQSDRLHSTSLKSELSARQDLASSAHHTENLTTYTQSSNESTTGSYATFLTNDISRLEGDVGAQKNYLSQVKFSWMESNVKRRFAQHIINDDPKRMITSQHNLELEEDRTRNKAHLKKLKGEADNLRATLAASAHALDRELTELQPKLDEVQTLTRAIRSAELELAALRNSRPLEERLTIAEADTILEDQVSQLMALSTSVSTAKAQLESEQKQLALLKDNVEALEKQRIVAENAAAKIQQSGSEDHSVLDWRMQAITAIQDSFNTLVGIETVQTPNPNEIQVTYRGPVSNERQAATTLGLYFDPHTHAFVNAELLNSAERIDDAVNEARKTGDIAELVQFVCASRWNKAV